MLHGTGQAVVAAMNIERYDDFLDVDPGKLSVDGESALGVCPTYSPSLLV